MATYFRFPYRTFFRWTALIVAGAMIIIAPLGWYLYWADYRQTTIDALNTSASYRHDPGSADAATWDVAGQWPWVMLCAVVVFLFVFWVFRWARPARDRVHHD